MTIPDSHAHSGSRIAAAPLHREAPAGRQPWLDVARGVTILLVVLLHADSMLAMVGERSMPVHLVALALFPLRMPLFFLVSGILAASMLRRPAARVLTDRVGHFFWLWALWTAMGYGLINALLFPALGLPPDEGFFAPRLDPFAHLLSSNSWAWFLYALALFFALALLLRGLPPWLHMGVAIVLAVPGMMGLGGELDLGVLDRFYYYPYFAAGLLASGVLRAEVPRLGRWWVLLPALSLWAASTLMMHWSGWLESRAGHFLLSFLAVPATLSAAAILGPYRWSWPLRVAGTNTLVIYLLHPYLLRLIVELERPGVIPGWGWSILVVLAATVLSLALGPLLARVPGLLALPRRTPSRRVAAEA